MALQAHVLLVAEQCTIFDVTAYFHHGGNSFPFGLLIFLFISVPFDKSETSVLTGTIPEKEPSPFLAMPRSGGRTSLYHRKN